MVVAMTFLFGNQIEALANLSVHIDGNPMTVLMVGLALCGLTLRNFANFELIFNRQALSSFNC